jgi:hypothetical protein
MSRQPLGFVKERKTRQGGVRKQERILPAVFHKVPNPLTGKEGVIFPLVPAG